MYIYIYICIYTYINIICVHVYTHKKEVVAEFYALPIGVMGLATISCIIYLVLYWFFIIYLCDGVATSSLLLISLNGYVFSIDVM